MKFDPFSLILGTVMHANPIVGFGLDLAQEALSQVDVPTPVKNQVIAKMASAADQRAPTLAKVTLAPVKSAWTSKINWLCLAGTLLSVPAIFNHPIPSDVIEAATQFTSVGLFPAIALVRTFFTHAVVR